MSGPLDSSAGPAMCITEVVKLSVSEWAVAAATVAAAGTAEAKAEAEAVWCTPPPC